MKANAIVSVRDREDFQRAVQDQLDNVLASEPFRSSNRHQLLLRKIVSESLAGRAGALKEIVLAKDVFGRTDYDPKRHTLVRVEVNAVRRKLAEYYSNSGLRDQIQIEIPVGHYAATFSYLRARRRSHAWRKRYYGVAASAAALFLLLFTLFGSWRSHPPATAVPVQVTFDTGWTAQPAVSRDGSVLVYSSDRGARQNADVWIQQTGKAPRQLTDDPAHDITPDISPNGKTVVFRSWRKEEGVWSIPSGGGIPKLLAAGGYSPRFSPDGKRIAFAGTSTDEIGHVFTLRASGGVPEQLDYGTADAQCPVWSPDGSEAVFAAQDASGHNYDLWIAKVRGSRNEPSRPLGIEPQLQSRNLPSASLCPQDWIDGHLLFGARQHDTSFLFEVGLGTSGAAGRIQVVPSAIGATGARIIREPGGRLTLLFASERRRMNIWGYNPVEPGSLRQLTHDDSLRPGYYGTWPALSGDGNVLAFATERTGSPDICVKDLRSGTVQLLGASPSLQSPLFLDRTGSRIVFVRQQGSNVSVILRRIAGKTERVLTTGCPVLHDWSSDGRFLLCSQGNNLFQLRIGQSEKMPLLYLAHEPLSAKFSPHCRWTSYVSATGQGEDVEGFLAPLDGSKRRIQICHEAWTLSLGWAADGNAVYYWSTRDGFRCLYKQPLDPESKAPQGDPVAILHRHGVQSYPWSGGTLAVGSGRLAMTLTDELGNIWKANMPE